MGGGKARGEVIPRGVFDGPDPWVRAYSLFRQLTRCDFWHILMGPFIPPASRGTMDGWDTEAAYITTYRNN